MSARRLAWLVRPGCASLLAVNPNPTPKKPIRPILLMAILMAWTLWGLGCAGLDPFAAPARRPEPLTVSSALGQGDARRDASLRLVIAGLDEDAAGRPDGALARYQRAVRVDATNPFAYLALARHHLEAGSPGEAEAFLEQSRALFETQARLGPEVDVWGLGLRGAIERALGREDRAASYFEAARALAPEVWEDEHLSAGELR